MTDKQLDGYPSGEQVVASVATVADMLEHHPVSLESFTAAAAERGWTTPSRPSLFTTDLPTATGRVAVTVPDERVASVSLRFTKDGDPNSSELFAVYAAALSEAWGAPTKRTRGKIPTIHWPLPHVFVTLSNYQGNVLAEVFDPKAYQAQLASGSI